MLPRPLYAVAAAFWDPPTSGSTEETHQTSFRAPKSSRKKSRDLERPCRAPDFRPPRSQAPMEGRIGERIRFGNAVANADDAMGSVNCGLPTSQLTSHEWVEQLSCQTVRKSYVLFVTLLFAIGYKQLRSDSTAGTVRKLCKKTHFFGEGWVILPNFITPPAVRHTGIIFSRRGPL